MCVCARRDWSSLATCLPSVWWKEQLFESVAPVSVLSVKLCVPCAPFTRSTYTRQETSQHCLSRQLTFADGKWRPFHTMHVCMRAVVQSHTHSLTHQQYKFGRTASSCTLLLIAHKQQVLNARCSEQMAPAAPNIPTQLLPPFQKAPYPSIEGLPVQAGCSKQRSNTFRHNTHTKANAAALRRVSLTRLVGLPTQPSVQGLRGG